LLLSHICWIVINRFINMKIRVFIATILLSIILSAIVRAEVYDLPVTTFDGKDYYYYEVKPKETIYSLSHKLGVSQEDMHRYNPVLADGLKAGSTLYFPVEDFDVSDATIIHEVKKGETVYGISKTYNMPLDDLIKLNPSAQNGIKAGEKLIIKKDKSLISDEDKDLVLKNEVDSLVPNSDSNTDVVDNDVESEAKDETYNVAIILPFMLQKESQMSQTTRTYLDFYKGFLLAADSLRHDGANIKISVFDSHQNPDSLKSLLHTGKLKNMDVIIAPPGDASSVDVLVDASDKPGAGVVNLFYAGDTTHLKSHNVLQFSIGRDEMYAKVVDKLVSQYKDYIPVIIGSSVNRNRLLLANDIKHKYKEKGVSSKEILFTHDLTLADLTSVLDAKKKYIFIPMSSAEKEFKKYVEALKEFKTDKKANIVLFGYPEWINYKGYNLEILHDLNTVIYSRFFFDVNTKWAKAYMQKFKSVFKAPFLMTPPALAVLGFDSGYYILNALRRGNGDVKKGLYKSEGMQYGFDFDDATPSAGIENNSIFFIRYRQDGIVYRKMY